MGDSAFGEIYGTAGGVNVLSMTGLRLAIADNSKSLETRDTRAAARLVWGPDIDFVNLKEMVRLSTDLSSYTQNLEELYQLCLIHAQRCNKNSTIDKPHLSKFNTWVETRCKSLETVSICNLDSRTLLHRIRSLSNDLASTSAGSAAKALQSVCENINAIYTGHISSWEDLLTKEEVSGVYSFIDQCDISPFIQRLGHCKPNLRILEIGSWRRQPSRQVLDSLKLPDGRILCSKYKFTSEGFDASFEDQTQSAMVEYSILDIQEDPWTQGFDGEQYDLILANNTIHYDRSISTSLRNIGRLLSPGGHLLLQELCPVSKWPNFIFGTQSSWWCGLNDGRLEEPYISRQKWQQELSVAGFESSNAGLLDSDEPFHLNSIFAAKAATTNPPSRCVSLLCNDQDQDVGPIHQCLEAKGFQVSRCTLNDWPQPRQDVIALLDSDKPFFENLDARTFSSLKTFLNRLDDSGLLWITKPSQLHCQDPRYAQVLGTARTVRSELLIDFATCEVDDVKKSTAQIAQVVAKFRERVTVDSLKPDFEFSIHEGVIRVGRYYPFNLWNELLVSDPESGAKLDIEVPGRLGTLYWTQQSDVAPLQPEEVEVEMYSVSLNFRDVLVAIRIIELPERVLGLEGAGVVRRVGSRVKALRVGDRVGLVERGAFSTQIRTLEIFCVKLPEKLDLSEAATMFLPYITAMHSLITVGGLKKGQSVLIHSACGGIGIAAVQIAQMVAAEVYITVGTDEKVQYAVKTLNIPRHRIFSSRDQSFTDGIMRETQGQGIDLVLNSLSGELLHATWRCVSPFGKVVEIGKRDLIGFGKLDMNPFLANRSYCCIDIDAFRERPAFIHQMLQSILELFEAGKITTIPTRSFSAASTCDAFRFMQRGQHIGRICVSIRDTAGVSNLEDKVQGQPKYPTLHDSASYLLVGGLGGLGRAISVWMVERGARHLIFLSPSAGSNPDHDAFIKELESMGCHAQIYSGSVINPEDVARVISGATRPLKGILQMSMVLHDVNFFDMSLDQWNAAIGPKIQGTWNLHNATVSAGLDLDFLVLFSSIAGIVGLPGQANYASLAASAIDIGAVGDVGYIFEHQDVMQKMTVSGIKTLNEEEVLDGLALAMVSRKPLRNFLSNSDTHTASNNVYVLGLASTMPLRSPMNRAVWKDDRRMAIYHNTSAGGDGSDSAVSNETIKSCIASAKTDISLLKNPDAGPILGTEIGKRLCNLLMKPEEDLDTSLYLADLGLDSLVGIELRAWCKQALGIDISVLEMLGKGTLGALGQHAANELAKVIQAE